MRNPAPEMRPCRACGIAVPQDAPFGHCPSCLVELGFGQMPEDWTSVPARARSFGGYELLEQLGRGGMGVVYKARQVSLNRLVALKMLSPQATAFPSIAERLRLEAEMAGSLHHLHIVTIYDVGMFDGQPFYTMELIEGTSLDKLIAPDGFHPEQKSEHGIEEDRRKVEAAIAHLMIQIALAVEHAHKHGVLHRDLKPANVVVDAQGQPHLTDFGLAKVLGQSGISGTATGAILGTPAYMAPEQASGAAKHATTAVDIYSMGAILYEMLTGRPPFKAETPLDMLRQVVQEAPKHPSTINRAVDRDLATVCLKCLEKNPQDRYSSAQALAEDLERWSKGEPIEARSVHNLRRFWCWCKREPLLASLVAGLFLLLAAVAGLALALYQRERSRLAQGAQIQLEKTIQLRAALDRLENVWNDTNRTEVRVSAQELALISDRALVVDGTEVPVLLGLISSRLRGPDEEVYQMAPLVDYLQVRMTNLGAPPVLFELQIYTRRPKALEDLLQDKVDLMRTDPADYVGAHLQNTNIFPLVKQLYSGQPDLHAAIFTLADSGISRLEDLKGKSFGFGKEQTALGDYVPKAALVRGGLWAGDFQRLTNTHSTAVIAAVRAGSCEAGVAEWDDLTNATTLGYHFTILEHLHCPSHPWAATKKLDSKMAESIRTHLQSFRSLDAAVGFEHRLTGFTPALPEDYDQLARDIETARQFDQPR